MTPRPPRPNVDYAVLTSADGFTAASALATLNVTTSGSTNQVAISGNSNVWGAGDVEIRLYGWNAGATNGNTHVNAVRTDASFRTAPQAIVRPTGMLLLQGDYVQFADAILEIELAGTNFASGRGDYDRLSITGNATLAGKLLVSTISEFSPAPGNVFDILDFGTLTGRFGEVILPTLSAGLSWNIASLYVNGTIQVASGSSAVPEPQGLAAILTCSILLQRRRRGSD